MKKVFLIILTLLISLNIGIVQINANADELTDNISDQLENIDLEALEDYYSALELSPNDGGIIKVITDMLNGKYTQDYNNFFDFVKDIIFLEVKTYLPILISVLAIAIFCGIMQALRSSFNFEGVGDVVFFVCLLAIILLLSKQIIGFYKNTKNTIENISKLTEILSPIILSLMIACGGNVSASVYSPTVGFLSGGVINVFKNVVLPLVGIVLIFSLLSNITTSVKLNKFTEFFSGVIKWVIGIIVTIFTLFISLQGIASATFDGVSIKAAKYTISNSIPIVGGFLRDGFDLVVAGSVLIKNAVGISVVIALFYTILVPVFSMLTFSILLKFVSAVSESVSDARISAVFMALSKCISYLIAVLLTVAFMLFIVVLLMIFSANAFI